MFRSFFSFIFFTVGLILLFLFSYALLQRFSPWGLEKGFGQYIPAAQAESTSIPQRITIQSLNIDLPIIPSTIKDNKFETTKDGASYLLNSGVPGKSGNVIVYGHNWPNILGRLHKIKVGDTVRVYSDSSTFSEYQIEYTATISPDEVHVLSQTDDARITIYTCAGFLDSKRFVAVGTLVK